MSDSIASYADSQLLSSIQQSSDDGSPKPLVGLREGEYQVIKEICRRNPTANAIHQNLNADMKEERKIEEEEKTPVFKNQQVDEVEYENSGNGSNK